MTGLTALCARLEGLALPELEELRERVEVLISDKRAGTIELYNSLVPIARVLERNGAHAAFDAMALLEHAGDVAAAVRAARLELGLRVGRGRPRGYSARKVLKGY